MKQTQEQEQQEGLEDRESPASRPHAVAVCRPEKMQAGLGAWEVQGI